MIPLFSHGREGFLAEVAWEYTLSVSLAVFAQSRDGNVSDAAFFTAIVAVMSAHMMIQILKRYMNNGADDALITLAILQAER